MRKLLLLFSTVVLGLASVNSASAGFVAGANTRVALVSSYYTSATGLVNKFAATATPGTTKMITTPGSFVPSPASTYSQLLGSDVRGYKVYLVAPTGSGTPSSSTFSVSFTGGETVVGVAGSNGWKNFESGTMAANVWGSHIALQPLVQSALISLFGSSAPVLSAASATGVFGTTAQAIEIQGLSTVGNPDGYFRTLSSVNGTVYSTQSGGVNGLNEMSLVFTVVPEPTSLGLFGVGTLVVGLVRLRRKKL